MPKKRILRFIFQRRKPKINVVCVSSFSGSSIQHAQMVDSRVRRRSRVIYLFLTRIAAMSAEERENINARRRERRGAMSVEDREKIYNAMSAEERENIRASKRKRENARIVAMSAEERENINARRQKRCGAMSSEDREKRYNAMSAEERENIRASKRKRENARIATMMAEERENQCMEVGVGTN